MSLYPSRLSCPEELSDIYETVKVSLILIAPVLFQARMLLERLIVRCVLLFVGRSRRWNFVPATDGVVAPINVSAGVF